MKAIAPYSGRSMGGRIARCNPCCKAWLSPKKSIWVIIPEKSMKADGEKDPAVTGNASRQESGVLKAVARKRMPARG